MQVKEPFEKPVQFTEEEKKVERLVNLGPLGKAGPTVGTTLSPTTQFRGAPVKEGVEQFGDRLGDHNSEALHAASYLKAHKYKQLTDGAVKVFHNPLSYHTTHVRPDGSWSHSGGISGGKDKSFTHKDSEEHGRGADSLHDHLRKVHGRSMD